MILLHSCAKWASLGPINPKWKDLEVKQVFHFVSCFHWDWKVSSNQVGQNSLEGQGNSGQMQLKQIQNFLPKASI